MFYFYKWLSLICGSIMYFGVFLPTLISAPSDELVLGGIILTVGAVLPILGVQIWRDGTKFGTYLEQKEEKKNKD